MLKLTQKIAIVAVAAELAVVFAVLGFQNLQYFALLGSQKLRFAVLNQMMVKLKIKKYIRIEENLRANLVLRTRYTTGKKTMSQLTHRCWCSSAKYFWWTTKSRRSTKRRCCTKIRSRRSKRRR